MHKAVSAILDDVSSLTEPVEPERYVSFIISYILMGVTFGKK